jgi:hypothetical protein
LRNRIGSRNQTAPRSPNGHSNPTARSSLTGRRTPRDFQKTIGRWTPIGPQVSSDHRTPDRPKTIGSRFRCSCPGRSPSPRAPPGKGPVPWMQFELKHASSLCPCLPEALFARRNGPRGAAAHPSRAHSKPSSFSSFPVAKLRITPTGRCGTTAPSGRVAKRPRAGCERKSSVVAASRQSAVGHCGGLRNVVREGLTSLASRSGAVSIGRGGVFGRISRGSAQIGLGNCVAPCQVSGRAMHLNLTGLEHIRPVRQP